jgi:pimeloyl-ACP methyl ester carboxylesterase
MNRLSHILLILASCGLACPARAEVPAFAGQTPPAAPDYALASSWAAGPFGPGASAALPKGATPAARNAPADVFYVHPTTYRSQTQWNQDVADVETNRWTDASVIARQASVFNGCCRVFAPRYRQASFLNKDGGRDLALQLAYGDVARAFDYYLEHENHGRPFIIAGHSQGAWLIAELLEKRIDGTPLQKQLVAAYLVGINVAEGEFGLRYKHVPVCETPAQIGCAVQWNSVLPGTDLPKMAAAYQTTFVKTYGEAPGKTTVCVNPMTFDRARPAAAAKLNAGAVPGDPGEGALRALVKGAVAAHCDQGLLVVDPAPALDLKPLPGGVMHYHDLGLFYADVRANAVLRVKGWLKAHRGK